MTRGRRNKRSMDIVCRKWNCGPYHHFRFHLMPGNQSSLRMFCFLSCLKTIPQMGSIGIKLVNTSLTFILACFLPSTSFRIFASWISRGSESFLARYSATALSAISRAISYGTPYPTRPPAFGSRQGITPKKPVNCVCNTPYAFAVFSEETDVPASDDAICRSAKLICGIFRTVKREWLCPRFPIPLIGGVNR